MEAWRRRTGDSILDVKTGIRLALDGLFDVKAVTKHRRRVVTDRVFGRDPLYQTLPQRER